MKSHELAQALNALSRLLKSGPNVELSQLKMGEIFDSHSNRDLALNLSTLVSLSSVDKQKWMELIRENGFPIEIRPRDGSRDIFGKLCAYLESNPQAQEQLKARAIRTSGKSSPELMKALATLLKDQRNEFPFPDMKKDQGNEPPSEGN
jgi:hypothetical protein